MKDRSVQLLLVLFILAILLRLAYLPSHLFFGPEQGIDFHVVKTIVMDHKFTLIGAKTDISGIFHGPIYYYVLCIPFLFSAGDPFICLAFLIFINCLTIFFIYLLGSELKSEKLGAIAALLFTVSLYAIQYSRWLSTHPLSFPLVTMGFWFFLRFLKGNKQSLVGFSISTGLLMQAEFLNIIFFTVITGSLVLIYKNRFLKHNVWYVLANFFILVLIALGPYLAFDLRHEFLISKNILALVMAKSGYYVPFSIALMDNLRAYMQAFTATIVPQVFLLGITVFTGLVLVISRQIVRKDQVRAILGVWLFVPLLILTILRHNALDQFFISLIPGFIVLTAYGILLIWEQSKALGVALTIGIVSINLIAYARNIPTNNAMVFQTTQPHLYYSDELAAIDWIYKEADGQQFMVQTYTIPYFFQQGWTYLFWSYGFKTYGYLPKSEKAPSLFVIVQKDSDMIFQKNWLEQTVSTWGNLRYTKQFGDLSVQRLNVPPELRK
jgi:hypothetical protein